MTAKHKGVQLDEFSGALYCPACGGDYLHHRLVEIFDRIEDADTGLHIKSGEGKIAVDSELGDNPSSRRHGVLIHFFCEGCDHEPTMSLTQHKGQTFLSMRT